MDHFQISACSGPVLSWFTISICIWFKALIFASHAQVVPPISRRRSETRLLRNHQSPDLLMLKCNSRVWILLTVFQNYLVSFKFRESTSNKSISREDTAHSFHVRLFFYLKSFCTFFFFFLSVFKVMWNWNWTKKLWKVSDQCNHKAESALLHNRKQSPELSKTEVQQLSKRRGNPLWQLGDSRCS